MEDLSEKLDLSRKPSIYAGKQALIQHVDVKIDQIGLKYARASNAIRNFLRFYGFINVSYDGSPESFQLLVRYLALLCVIWVCTLLVCHSSD